MTDTLSREELDEIRGRDARAADDPHTWTVADRHALLAHIDTLTAALRETTKAFHALNWHDRPVFGRRGYTFETCPIERCVTNRAILNGEHQ
jgi:hypothetical protein